MTYTRRSTERRYRRYSLERDLPGMPWTEKYGDFTYDQANRLTAQTLPR